MKRMTMTMGALAAAAITGTADAAIIFFTDEALFNQALADAGKISKGIEDFEQALILPNQQILLNDPLDINNLQGLFPSFMDNLTFQSNTNGTPNTNDPGVNGLNPRGVNGMFLAGPVLGYNNFGLITLSDTDSLDILSGPPAGGNHTALGMHVFSASVGVLFPIEVRVFDKNETEVGIIFFPGLDINPQFLGILATEGDTIGRVNIWNVQGFPEGVFDVQTYLIPAPSALALLTLAGLFGTRRRRR